MQEKVELIKNNGEKLTVDLISEFDCDVNGSPKRFVLLTANEIDQNGLVKILASNIANGRLNRIESDDEWTLVKNVMRSIISSSKGDFTYTNTSDNMSFEVDDNYARVIAVQDSAKQALVNDYNEKKPEAENQGEVVEENQAEDPNAAIYPTETESTPIGSEVVPGIAEMTPEVNEEENETPVVEETNSEDVSADIPTPDVPTFEDNSQDAPTPTQTQSTNDSARDELVNSIIAAVDKYIASKNNNSNVKDTIAKMQEELNKMNEALNTQE